MKTMNPIEIIKDLPNKKLMIVRKFEASPERVWKAWTESHLLDQWWAPKPWKAETKTFQFKDGGQWLYAMVSPKGEKHWCIVDFHTIIPSKSFQTICFFCDENGKKDPSMPQMNWKNEFHATETGSKVVVEISFSTEADITKIIQMGFEAGFTMGLENLEHYLMVPSN